MSRPKPKILLETTNKKTYKSEQILEAEAIWAVFYKNEPFNLKSFNVNISKNIGTINYWVNRSCLNRGFYRMARG